MPDGHDLAGATSDERYSGEPVEDEAREIEPFRFLSPDGLRKDFTPRVVAADDEVPLDPKGLSAQVPAAFSDTVPALD